MSGRSGPVTIDLTPNYPALYEHFAKELDAVGDLLVRYPDLVHLHSWLAPLAIAFQAVTSAEQMVQLREHVGQLLRKVADKAAQEWDDE